MDHFLIPEKIIEEIREKGAKKVSAGSLSDEYNITLEAISAILQEKGEEQVVVEKKRKPKAILSPKDRQDIKDLRESGTSVKEIAELYDVNLSSVYRIGKNEGGDSALSGNGERRRGVSQSKKDQIIELHNEGVMTQADIANALGLSYNQVINVIAQYRKKGEQRIIVYDALAEESFADEIEKAISFHKEQIEVLKGMLETFETLKKIKDDYDQKYAVQQAQALEAQRIVREGREKFDQQRRDVEEAARRTMRYQYGE